MASTNDNHSINKVDNLKKKYTALLRYQLLFSRNTLFVHGSNQLLFLMILVALLKSVFDFLCNVVLEIYFRIRALTKYLTNETE